jgi:DNA-binding NtrC family response regulator
MTFGKRLLLFSGRDPDAEQLVKATAGWGCLPSACRSIDELRGRLVGGEHDLVLVEPASALRRLVAEPDGDALLLLPLAEVEKRHIHQVLASTGGNKTRAARVLGIDTKTLYNKLKSYRSSEDMARKRESGSSSSLSTGTE